MLGYIWQNWKRMFYYQELVFNVKQTSYELVIQPKPIYHKKHVKKTPVKRLSKMLLHWCIDDKYICFLKTHV